MRTGPHAAWALPLVPALVGALLSTGCADFARGDPQPRMADAGALSDADDATSDGATSSSFAIDIDPLLVPTCQRCHAPGQAAGETQLLLSGAVPADYAAVVMFVDTSSPAGSRLLAKMSGTGHSGGTVYAVGSPEYLKVLRWIEQGAKP